MRMAYVCADAGVPVFGQKGCSLHVQEITRAFRHLGFDVTLFARTVGGTAPADLADMPVIGLSRLPKSSDPERERLALRSNDETARLISSGKNFDFAYERYSLWSYSALAAARARGAVTILEVNAPLVEEQSKFRSLHDRDGAQAASLRAFSAADVIVAVSEEVAEYLNDFRQARGKVHVIPNGVNARRFEGVTEARTHGASRFTLGFVGTLKPWHGVDVLVDAFHLVRSRIPEARLLIVGDGPERERLEKQCSELGIRELVEFTGSVDPADVPGYLARMNIGIAPYPKLSSFYFSPLKVYEYLASGMPVIASDIGQLKDIVFGTNSGVLCEPGDVRALSEAVVSMHADPERMREMGQAGRKHVLSECTWDSVALRVLNLSSLLGDHSGQQGLAK